MQSDQSGKTGGSLTHQQMLMWTGQQLDPNSPIYNMAFRIGLPFAIDESNFKRAFSEVVAQSQSHRTVIRMRQGQPEIQTLTEIDFDLAVHDFSDRSNPIEYANAWCDSRCRVLFDLSDRMFDSALIKCGNENYVWFISHHHLISDAWSSTQLLRLLSKAYSSLLEGKAVDQLNCEASKNHPVGHANSGNSEFLPVRFFGFDGGRLSSQSSRMTVVRSSDELNSPLNTIINDRRAESFSVELSRFNVLLALLFALLYRVSGQQELRIGVPFHNRLSKGCKESLGMFITLHPISIHVDNDDTFESLFGKVRTASNEFLKKAASGRNTEEAGDRYNVVFNYINAEFGTFAGQKVCSTWLHPGCHDREHHLRMHIENFDGQNEIKFDLNSNVFDQQRGCELASHFRTLVSAVALDWGQVLQAIPLTNEAYISKLLSTAAQDDVSNELICAQLDRIINELGDKVAIIDGPVQLTYAELNQRVDEVCHLLDVERIGTRKRVAICLDRSVESVISILAVMRSGNAFVLLDPTWPSRRLIHIFDDSSAVCVITDSRFKLPDRCDERRLNLDESRGGKRTQHQTTLPDDSAYVLYTSGSTGKPKGVEISHAAIAHYVNWAVGFYGKGNRLSFPLFTPLTFDLTLTSIFVPLLSGGTIVVYKQRPGGHDTTLLQVLDDDLVDVIKLTPSHLSLLAGQQFSESKVKQLILGGEDLSSDLASRTFNCFSNGLRIHNEYGPTEATVGCVVETIDASSDLSGTSVPIGKPISGTAALVLNEQLVVQPDGVAGELFIVGKGLAKGYVNLDELTDERFVRLDAVGGARAYRTGDVARWNQQGKLEYLGRVDGQVKIRGARIELSAIESALREHSEIVDAVVTAYQPRAIEETVFNCIRCGLASNFPGVVFDEDGVCEQCRAFENYQQKAEAYFRNIDDLQEVLTRKAASDHNIDRSGFDCLALLSGGKDSSYMVARLVDLDLKVLAFTLDNGYISEEAKANIRRVTQTLGVEHVFASTPYMNKIFVDSLKRFSNVCQGCFKTIYTLAMNLALEKKIPFIVTGLSRGQLFETRLTRELFEEPCDNLVQIDQSVLDARKAYHKVEDAIFQNLDVARLQQDESFEKVQFVDFYRFCHVTLEEMLQYLNEKLPWIRPGDTGRSTNCLINDVGIYVHKRNEGFHNYTMPYSWDVRMGHKTRDEAVEELVDRIDVKNVHRILAEIGYDGELSPQDRGARLVAYYSSETDIPVGEIQSFLKSRLPEFMLPSKLVAIDSVPLTDNGKVDKSRLPDPFSSSSIKQNTYVAPVGELEEKLVQVWQRVLGVDKIGVKDNFFDLGGDSILAIQIVALANQNGIKIKPSDMFESLTVSKLATRAGDSIKQVSFDLNTRQKFLTPIQSWMFDHQVSENDCWVQSIELKLPDGFDLAETDSLAQAIMKIVEANPALRTKIDLGSRNPRLTETEACELKVIDAVGIADGQQEKSQTEIEEQLSRELTFGSSKQISGRIVRRGESDFRLLLMANHLAVDAVSWQRIVSDLDQYFAADERTFEPDQVQTVAAWTEILHQHAQSEFGQHIHFWKEVLFAEPPFVSPGQIRSTRSGADFDKVSMELGSEATAVLEASTNKSRMRLHELLLAAFARTLATVSGQDQFRILVEGHGREDLDPASDFSRTVGWFTSLYPVRFTVPGGGGISALNDLKEQIRAVPGGGVSFGALRYLSEDEQTRRALSLTGSEVVFNFLGKRIANSHQHVAVSRPLKLHRSPSLERRNCLEFDLVIDDELRAEVEFARDLFSSAEVLELGKSFFEYVSEMASELASKDSTTASDFPLAKLDSRQLSDLAAILKRTNEKG